MKVKEKKKRKRRLTLNQKRVLDRIKTQVQNGAKVSVTAAMRGIYSPSTATKPDKINTLPEFMELLEEQLPDDHLAMRHRELLDKREQEVVVLGRGKKTRIERIDKGPDVQAVKAGLDMAYKIRGRYPKDGPNVAIQFNMREGDNSFKK